MSGWGRGARSSLEDAFGVAAVIAFAIMVGFGLLCAFGYMFYEYPMTLFSLTLLVPLILWALECLVERHPMPEKPSRDRLLLLTAAMVELNELDDHILDLYVHDDGSVRLGTMVDPETKRVRERQVLDSRQHVGRCGCTYAVYPGTPTHKCDFHAAQWCDCMAWSGEMKSCPMHPPDAERFVRKAQLQSHGFVRDLAYADRIDQIESGLRALHSIPPFVTGI